MFMGLARLFTVIVIIITVQQVAGHDSKQNHGGGRNATKTKHIVLKNNTARQNNKFHKTTTQFPSKPLDKTRKSRGIPLSALAGLDRAALGLNPVVLPYGTRLASLGFQQTPALQQIQQLRGLVPTTGGLLQNAATLRLPYALQLARLLPALNLYRNRLQLPVNGGSEMATDVHVYKSPNRLKYDSIPIKPQIAQQEMVGNGLNLPALLQLNNAADQGLSELSDESEADLAEIGGVCVPNPCHNRGSCVNLGETFECICKKGYTGKKCKERNPCLPNPCNNDGQCTVSGSSYDCSCTAGWKGVRCEEPNKCHPNPCKNGGLCTELEFDYECTCPHGFRGKSCEEKREGCSPNPCLNDGQCIETSSGSFDCICKPGFSGAICSVMQNKCLQNPCQNGGTCTESSAGGGFECRCSIGYKGMNCEERSPCQTDTCQNGGTCFETESGFKCLCQVGYGGKTCSVRHSCQPNVCKNGAKCIEHDSGFKCICPPGYKGSYCDEVDHCRPNPCQHGGDCVETENGYKCHCQAQYQGTRCEDLNMCIPSPCKNGGQCLGYAGGYKCLCPAGYKGNNCDDKNPCDPNPCHNGAPCLQVGDNFKCSCRRGYTGDQCKMVDSCLSNPCQHGGTCRAEEGGFVCSCPAKYRGVICNEREPCHPNPCRNGGKCLSTSEGFVCRCATGYRGETCTEEDECEPNPCQNGGRCVAHYFGGGFDCECPLGFRGTTCLDKDPCRPNPCGHGGFCSEIGGGFACNCTLGFKGATCLELDQCHPNPCAHGGSCREVVGGTGFACQCITGYKGARCDVKDQCHPNPCLHDGMCMEVNDELGFLCNCTAGYRGSHCQDLDPCRPNPCLNSGACLHTDDGFVCNCSMGFKGTHCQERDLCKPNPCQFGNKCHQTGIDSYQCVKNLCNPSPCMHNGQCIEINDEDYKCVCPIGYMGKNCNEPDLCQPNPCKNGGTCSRTKNGGYKCHCMPGYDGTNCEEFGRQANADGRHNVPEVHSTSALPNNLKAGSSSTQSSSEVALQGVCHPNPCRNGGSCFKSRYSFNCKCTRGYKGKHCELMNACIPNPCNNGGTCLLGDEGSFVCRCPTKFSGATCEEANKVQRLRLRPKSHLNACIPNPCNNGGTCLLGDEGSFVCRCPTKFSGATCEEANKVQRLRLRPKSHLDYCNPNPCKNKGVCVVEEEKGYSCACEPGFAGFHCQDDHCNPNPCHNRGVCVRDKTRHYRCNCHNGFLGRNCDVNSCVPNPCKNGGLCVTVPGKGYQCKCRDGFNGPHCESNPCYPNPCNNGGSCLVFYTVYLCKCPRAYRGTRCNVLIPDQALAPPPPPVTSANFISEVAPVRKTTENMKDYRETSGGVNKYRLFSQASNLTSLTQANPCTSNPCLNSAVCLETIDDNYECFCRGDFSGPRCEDVGAYKYSSAPKFFPGKGEECLHCDRDAHCVGGHCICKHGFVGDGLDCWVETQRDKDWMCQASPCMNGGTCKPGISKCVCRLGYVGDYCESYCPPSIHLSFDKYTQSGLQDDSGSGNDGLLANGAQIVPHGGKCGNAANLLGGDVLLDGAHFQRIPREGITIATWIKLDTNKGIQSIFDTVGSHSRHSDGQYHFEIENAKVRWFHRNEDHNTIFSLQTRPLIREGEWTQITATYNAKRQRARVYVNGDLREEVRGQGLLSQDWGGKAGIGRHKHQFGNRLLRGMIDEFYIFPCELPRLEVLVLMRHCHVYFKHAKKVTEESSTTRGPASIMTLPTNGQRNNQPYLPRPSPTAVSQSFTTVAPAYHKQQPTSSDFIANNLQQILASLSSENQPPGSNPSTMSRPHQAYGKDQQQAKAPNAYKPVSLSAAQPQTINSNQIAQTLPSYRWNYYHPGAAAPVSNKAAVRYGTQTMQSANKNLPSAMTALISAQSQGTLRHETPAAVQQMKRPLLGQASPTQQMSSNRQPALLNQNSYQTSSRLNPPAKVQQGNAARIQQVPIRNFQGYNYFPTSAGSMVNNHLGFPERTSSYAQIHNPIVWHIPLPKTKTGVPVRFRIPLSSLSYNSMGQVKAGQQLNVHQSGPPLKGIVQNMPKTPVASFQQPFVQKQQVKLIQPMLNQNPEPGGARARVASPLQQNQQSLSSKLALLEAPHRQTITSQMSQTHFPQTAAPNQRPSLPIRAYNNNMFARPPYSPSVRQKVLLSSNRIHPSLNGALAQTTQHLPQVAPLRPHYIYGQNSWPWGAWRNQAPPLKLASSRSSSPQWYPTTNSPFAVSPQVLLYYYLYPKTIMNPLNKLGNLRGEKGSFWQKLKDQISRTVPFRNLKVATVASDPTVTGQIQVKPTTLQTGQSKSNIATYGAFRPLVQTSKNAPYYRVVKEPLKTLLSGGLASSSLRNPLQAKQQVQSALTQTPLVKGMRQTTYLPQQTPWTLPGVANQLGALTQPQATVDTQLPGDRKSQLMNGLRNRPIYIQTVPYQTYYLLQQQPAYNTQSDTQRYLSKVLGDILRLRYLTQKKKKKRRGAEQRKSASDKTGVNDKRTGAPKRIIHPK